MFSAREVLDMLHEGAKRAVGQVYDFVVGEDGAGRHVAKGDLVALDQLAGEKQSQRDELWSARCMIGW